MATPDYAQGIDAYYGGADFEAALLDAVQAAGADPAALGLDDLGSLDHLHSGGRAATEALGRLAGLSAADRVLDVGSGLGGPARALAATFGCHVTGLELVADFCRAAERVTARVGLADRVAFRQGNALGMPIPDATFDVVWMYYVGMNVPDKERLYAEIHRVLRPGGRYVVAEWMGGEGPLHFPLPWARDAALSFVRPAREIRALVAATGLRERHWRDRTAEWLAPGTPDRPRLPLNIWQRRPGFDPRLTGETMRRNVEGGRMVEIEALWDRP